MAEPGRAACSYAEEREYLPTERIGVVAWALCEGERLTVEQVAGLAGTTYQGARQLLLRLSRGVPILCYRGRWMSCRMAAALQIPNFPKEDELPE